ncbi:DUF1073 domain-containing protein, partial [Morganella morganii]
RRWGFQTKYVTEIISRLCVLGVISQPESGDITLAWSDMLAPSEADKIDNMIKMADAAWKSQQAFGMAIFTPNEIRAVGELEPIEDDAPPETGPKGDPLADDKEPENRVTDNTEK